MKVSAIATVFELLGCAAIVYGAYLWSGLVLALPVLGLVLILVGLALEGAEFPRKETPEVRKKPRAGEEPVTNEKMTERIIARGL